VTAGVTVFSLFISLHTISKFLFNYTVALNKNHLYNFSRQDAKPAEKNKDSPAFFASWREKCSYM